MPIEFYQREKLVNTGFSVEKQNWRLDNVLKVQKQTSVQVCRNFNHLTLISYHGIGTFCLCFGSILYCLELRWGVHLSSWEHLLMLCFGLSTLRLKLPPTKPSLQFPRITKKKKEKKVKRRKEHFGQIDSQHITLYVRVSN